MQFDEISLNVAQSNHSSNFVKIYLQFVLIHFFLLEMSRDYRAPTCFTACFSKAFPKGEYANSVCSVICLWLKGNVFSPVRYEYLSIFSDYNADIFANSLLISLAIFHL